MPASITPCIPSPEEIETAEHVLSLAASEVDSIDGCLRRLQADANLDLELADVLETEGPLGSPLVSDAEAGRLFFFARWALEVAEMIKRDADALLDYVYALRATDEDRCPLGGAEWDAYRARLADYFETQAASFRSAGGES